MRRTHHSATTSELHIAYEQTGPDSGEPMVLLHGFPYDVREYDEVRDLLADRQSRIIVPYLRGFGPTRYRSAQTLRSGQQAALGKDIIEFLDALGIERARLVADTACEKGQENDFSAATRLSRDHNVEKCD